MSCYQKRLLPTLEGGNNRCFDLAADITRQDHPGFPKCYLKHEREFVQVVPGFLFKEVPGRMEQPDSGLPDLHIFKQIGKCANFYIALQRNLTEMRMNSPALLLLGINSPALLVIRFDSARPKGPHVEIAKDEAKPKPVVGVIVRERNVVQSADSLMPQKRRQHLASDIV